MNGSVAGGERRVFTAVSFDLFGTLVDLDQSLLPRLSIDGRSLPSLLAAPFARLRELVPAVDLADVLVAYFQAASDLGRPPCGEPDREIAPGEHFARCLERAGIADETLAHALAQAQMDATLRAARPAEGALLVLSALRDRGCTLGLVSNVADALGGRTLLSRLGMAGYLDAVVFSGDVGWRKPDRRMFETAIAAMRVSPGGAVHVGDELRADVWGAGRCGLASVWVNSTGERFEGEYPPRLTISRLATIMEAGLTL